MRTTVPLLAVLGALLAGVLLAAPARAQEEAPAAQTADDPDVALDVLALALEPLRRDELAAEAEAWAGLLRESAGRVAEAKIARERASGEEAARLEAEVATLRDRRESRGRRLELVLDAWESKGGDASELRAYATAVTGLELDVTDVRAVWTTFLGWLTASDGGIAVGRSILFFLLILMAARIVANLAARLVRRSLTSFRNTPELLRTFLANSARNVIFIIGIVAALGQLGVDIGPLLAAIGAVGLVVGFALQDTLSNFASGVMILLYRPYELGHYVKMAGIDGTVESMSLVSTTVKTPDNQTLVVPNGAIWGGVITNVTGSTTRRVDLVVGIGYDDDPDRAQEILEAILREEDRVLADPEPVVALNELADSSVNFNVRPWVATADYWGVRSAVLREVKRRFDEAGISIPYPQRDVHLHQVEA